jgi:dipeptidyl-peptidase-4
MTGLAGLVVAAIVGVGPVDVARSLPAGAPPADDTGGPAAEAAPRAEETLDRPAGEKRLTIEAIYASPPITGRALRALRWMPDSRRVSYLIDEGEEDERQTLLMAARMPDGRRETLCILDTIPVPEDLRESEDAEFAFRSYAWAEERELAVFRFEGEIFTFDAGTGAVVRRTQSDVREANVAFAPDGRSIGFTRDHDLWAMDLESGEEIQLTTTGSDSIFNGVLDWVYMEELFTRGNVRGYWWSPDGRAIAYLQFDESPVETFPIVDFSGVYNTVEMQHYPKAGSPNPLVRVAVYHFDSGETVWLDIDTSDDSYIARLYWLGDSRHVAMEKLNRDQDELRLLFADVSSGHVREVFKESRDTWIEVDYMKHYYETSDEFVWASNRDGTTHLYLFKNDGTMKHQLTSGMWEVSALNDVDEEHGYVYFTALEKSFLERHLYRVGDNGEGFRRLSRRDGSHSVTFSPNHRYYIDRFSNTSTPPVISVHDASGKALFTLHDSSEADITEYELPAVEFFTIVRDGLEFQCSMIKPPHFDPEEEYPVIIYVYGGPHAQVVRNRWGGTSFLWHALMAQNGYIIFSLDNRGAYGKGAEWEDPVCRNLGNLELADQITGVEHLKSLPYVDSSRIGIWGWSYGGYMTCLAMFKEPGVFAAGAAVAPFFNDTATTEIYTERYMKHPDDNEEGYEDGSPINFVDGLEAPLLLVHGSADDNVHMQNTIQLIEELIDKGKDFELMVYPGRAHSIRGNTARRHLFTRLTRFFEQHLGPLSDTDSRYQQ